MPSNSLCGNVEPLYGLTLRLFQDEWVMQGTASVCIHRAILGLMLLAAVALPTAAAEHDSDNFIALSLAEMLRAARTVVSNNQDRINDPALGDKGLTAATVVAEAIEKSTRRRPEPTRWRSIRPRATGGCSAPRSIPSAR
jgi:hypothetical protein